MELIIAKEEYSDPKNIIKKIDYIDWKTFIDKNKNYYEWLEETAKGKNLLDNMDKIPEWAKKGVLEQLNKGQALAEFNTEKEFHELIIDFNPSYGFIRITLMKKINKRIINKLKEMAEYLDGYILKFGKKIDY